MKTVFMCEDCKNLVDDFYEYKDDFRNLHICEDCFNKEFGKRAKLKDKSWFIRNFNNPAEEFPKLKFLR